MSDFKSQVSNQKKSGIPQILVIDDEPELIESIEDVLKYEDYEIISASSGEEGLKLYHKHQPVLVILDLKMPKMSGIQFLDRIDLRPLDPLSVIVLTGHGSDDEVEQCFKKGITAFIRKPFNIYEFQGLVRNTISLKKAATEKKRREEIFKLEISRAKELCDLVMEPLLPAMEGVAVSIRYIPAWHIGGDVLEILELDEKRLLLFLADVTGHGVPAAITASTLKTLFQEISETDTDPAAICARLNRTMRRIILPDDIIAAFCSLIDLEFMKITYCLCGVPSPVILRDHEKIRLRPTGYPLGVFEDQVIGSETVPLKDGDVLVAFTDGISEVRSESGKVFGIRGMEETIGKRAGDIRDLTDSIVTEAVLFQKKESFHDDVIILTLRFSDGKKDIPQRPWNRFDAPDKYLLNVKTRYAEIDDLSRYCMKHIAEKFQVSRENIIRLRTAFFEMLFNAIEHGNLEMTDFKNDPDFFGSERYWEIFEDRKISEEYGERRIRIECVRKENRLEISIEDEGKGFHPDVIPDPIHEDHFTKPSGRGIALARMNVDRIFYGDKGSKVTLSMEL
ncbi:SpoIIE family protein phosphatase [Desulfobacterales bacterium HSG2]|nr:SpoIIE family protein phosphatase [Desulfobacterales bacterium HSG2]